jgi:cation transport regulator ChaB
MPYRRNADLPDGVKGALPAAAQSIFRNVFNSVESKGASEESAFRQAWGAVKRVYEQDDDGKWHKIEKAENTEKAYIEIPITKIDETQHLVFGWANVSIGKDGNQITDSQDDQIDIEELEQAAYEFMLHYRETGINHEGEAVGKVVESFVATPAKLEKMGLEPDALPIGWLLTVYIEDDDNFQRVVKGELSMFSIQGTAIREDT